MTEDANNREERGLLDTSIFIAEETGRPLGPLPRVAAVSVVTIAELHLGVLMATDPTIRARRLHTLTAVRARFLSLPIDDGVARAFAELAAEARRQGRRPNILDTWIAATAVVHGLPVFTQDDDFLAMPGVRIIRI